jgi:stage II sporulation protein D
MVHVERSGFLLEVHDTAQNFGSFANLSFKNNSGSGVFQVKPVFPSLQARESDDQLEISIVNGFMRLINTLDLEKYIPGTVESEGGATASAEYYKAQAVITRTFAIKNFHRHAHEGFNLCDGVHCQAFNGKSRMNREIYNATRQTENEILTDANGNPVITAFHANCGGLTGKASMIWNMDLDYLAPVADPFCDRSSHRNWTKTLTAAAWKEYLEKKGITEDRIIFPASGTERQKYLDPGNHILLMTEIREDLNLKSSFFQIEHKGDQVVISGHGYGHGLGLCQQGAMEMARVGYTYVDILMFYFKELELNKK